MKNAFFLFISICLFIGMIPALADGRTDRINRVKAAFILNIARYVEWPPRPEDRDSDVFMLCFYQNNPLGDAIETIHKKRIGNAHLSYRSVNSLAEKSQCDLLFLTQSQLSTIESDIKSKNIDEIKQIYALLYDKNILTMGDLSDSQKTIGKINGVIICLIRQRSRIGIEINMTSLNNSRLKLSSELLKLSKRN